MSALDMTPEQVATAASFLKERFATWTPETITAGLCTDLRDLGYAATMGNLQAVYTALAEAAKPVPLERLPEIIMNDSGAYQLRGYFDVDEQQVRVECIDDDDCFAAVDLNAAQLRQLATWSLGAADHLDGVELIEGLVQGRDGDVQIERAANPRWHAYVKSIGGGHFLDSAACRQAARKLLELADAHDAGGAA